MKEVGVMPKQGYVVWSYETEIINILNIKSYF